MRSVFVLVFVAIILSFTSLTVSAAEFYPYEKIVKLTIGDREANVNEAVCKMDEAAYVKNGRTLVPLRFLGEALGASVSWEGKTNTATVQLKDRIVKVTVGSKNAYISNIQTVLDVPAEIRNGRTFVPLRFIAEAFGATVNYDDKTESVAIVLIDMSGWKLLDYNLYYPPDWKGEFTDDGILHYASPQGSEVWIQITDEQLDDVIANFKNSAIDLGYTFIEEEYLYPEVQDLGKKMLFFEYDEKGSPYAAYEITIQQTEANVIIKEIYIPFEVLTPDMPIINTIVYQ